MRRPHWHDGDLGALLDVAALLVVLRFALRLLPFRVVQRGVVASAHRRASAVGDGRLQDDQALMRALRRAVRLLPGSRCLPQALAGLLLAARRGVRSRACIGVQVGSTEPFGAHAWLETARGAVIGGDQAAQFAPILVIEPFPPAEPSGGFPFLPLRDATRAPWLE